MPYPVAKAWFEENHDCIREGWYLQKTAPGKAWRSSMPMIPEIRYLLDNLLLIWREQTFSAFLWGTTQTAVEFHFVAADELEKTYSIVGK